MKEYQRKSKYKLPQAVYNTTIWRIRDYYRLKKIADDILEESGSSFANTPHSTNISDTVAQKVIKRDKYLKDLMLIDNTILEIPQEYRSGVWNNIHFRQAYPIDADRSTYGRYKSKFIYIMAEKFNLL